MFRRIMFLFALLSLLVAAGFVTGQDMYSEAPALAEKVAAGELPPVDERLPDEPLVVEPVEESANTAVPGARSITVRATAGHRCLPRWNPS